MELSNIISLEETNSCYIHLYKEGIFWKAYEKSAFLFIKHIEAYHVKKRYIKKIAGEIVSIGFPEIILEDLLLNRKVIDREKNSLSVDLTPENNLSLADYVEWKENIPMTPDKKTEKKQTEINDNFDLMAAIRSFPTTSSTPLECLQFIAGLQKTLSLQS